MQTGVYTIVNKTGENITELKITDNVTGDYEDVETCITREINDLLLSSRTGSSFFDMKNHPGSGAPG